MSEHPSVKEITQLLERGLDSPAAELRMRHLESCETCQRWMETLWEADESPLEPGGTRQTMADRSAREVEQRLFQRIHTASTVSQLAWLMTDGFLNVVVVLMRPIVLVIRQLDSSKGAHR